jgi:predicted hydrolase (HD superfamily)
MIKEGRARHILGVARKCYDIAKEEFPERGEEYAEMMFLLGYLHDVGYEFDGEEPHRVVGERMLRSIGADEETVWLVRHHGEPEYKMTDESYILNKADLSIDTAGRPVTIEERVADKAKRKGSDSVVYKNAVKMAEKIEKYKK